MVQLDPGLDALAHSQPRSIREHAPRPSEYIELANRHAQTGHALALFGLGHVDGPVQGIGGFFDVIGIDDKGFRNSRAAPANWLSISTPRSSSRAATNSLQTRFMPSCRLVTMHTSAAR